MSAASARSGGPDVDDFAELDAMIDACAKLAAPEFAAQIAQAAAPLVDTEIKRTARAGTTPDGTPWLPRKKDGGRALEHVADQIETKAIGNVVRATLSGPAVFSHFGAGIPRRQVLPDAAVSVPAPVIDAMTKGATQVFNRLTGAR
jgi:hypothetical protein